MTGLTALRNQGRGLLSDHRTALVAGFGGVSIATH